MTTEVPMLPEQPATHPDVPPEPRPEPPPDSYEVLLPAAATDVGVPDAPAPVSPTVGSVEPPPAAPVEPPPAAPVGPPQAGPVEPPPAAPFPPPPAPPGRWAFRILVATAVLLAAAIAVTATLGWSAVSDRRQGVADREAELAAIAKKEEAAARQLPEDFLDAALEQKLKRVKELDDATDVAFNNWLDGNVRLGVLNDAMDACNDAVIAYNNAAGPFPDHLFTAVPRRIDLADPETDCGRAFTDEI